MSVKTNDIQLTVRDVPQNREELIAQLSRNSTYAETTISGLPIAAEATFADIHTIVSQNIAILQNQLSADNMPFETQLLTTTHLRANQERLALVERLMTFSAAPAASSVSQQRECVIL